MLECGFKSRMNFQALVCGIFWCRSSGVFSGCSGFLPSFIGYWFSQWNKAKINAMSTLSKLIAELSLHTKWYTAGCTWWVLDVLYVIAPGPLERMCWRQFAVQWGDGKSLEGSHFLHMIYALMVWSVPVQKFFIPFRTSVLPSYWPAVMWKNIIKNFQRSFGSIY